MCVLAVGIGLAMASSAASAVSSMQQASANKAAIEQQSTAQANQISQQAGQQESEAAMQARAASADSVAAAGASGINTGSNSFLASLQTTSMNAANNEGLIMENEQNQQAGRAAETNSDLAEKASSPTFLGAAADIGLAGGSSYASGSLLMSMRNPGGSAGNAGY